MDYKWEFGTSMVTTVPPEYTTTTIALWAHLGLFGSAGPQTFVIPGRQTFRGAMNQLPNLC